MGLAKVIRHFQSNDPARVREVFAQAGLKMQAQRKRMELWLLVTMGERQIKKKETTTITNLHNIYYK